MPQEQVQIKELTPLSLLYHADNRQIVGRTRLQKLSFLVQKDLEEEGVDTLKFIAYDYGPFSKPLIEKEKKLQEMGLLEREEKRSFSGSKKYIYNLTKKGKKSYEHNLESGPHAEVLNKLDIASSSVIKNHNNKSLNGLIEFVYEEYPDTAENSVY